MRIIIHSGLPKTGTTAIQDWLADNSQILASENIFYPAEFPSTTERFHRFLIQELRGKRTAMSKTKHVITKARQDGVDTLVFSIEGITAHIDKIRVDMAKMLREIVGQDQLEFVICLRPYHSWATSLYKQCVITPPVYGALFPSALELHYGCALKQTEFITRNDIKKIADKTTIQARIKELFPTASIIFLEHGTQLLENFLFLLKLSSVPKTLTSAHMRNSSIPVSYIELLRTTNSWSSSAQTHKFVRAAINENLEHSHVHLNMYKFDSKLSLTSRARLAKLSLHILMRGSLGIKHLSNEEKLAYRNAMVKVSLTLFLRAITIAK